MVYKKQKGILNFAFITAMWFLLLSTSPAYAYLDLLTSSMMLQVILGGIAGLVVVLKVFWNRLLGLSGMKKDKKKDQ